MASRTIFSALSGRATLRAQPLDRGSAARIVRQMVERHRGAAAGEQLDRGQPDAGGRACDQRRLAREVSHVIAKDSFARALPGETPERNHYRLKRARLTGAFR
jgi:hypothetical protein